ncbi:MAG: hypothetical protein AMK75_07095 [Planctomycetes bacterium SM23_65]|nr:MAG: hypothetical protein AMK75_07095 [Planctomycetes bacterium SM23_65]
MKLWTFVHVADMQPGSPRSFRFNPAWAENWQTAQKQIREINPELLLVGGDLTRDGSIHDFELEAAKADLDAMPFPCHVIPGNMDTGNKHAPCQGARDDRDDLSLNVTSGQIERYKHTFGEFPWSFIHRNVRFSGFYAALAGSGLSEEDQMWTWLEGLKDLPRAEHHVIITHYPLFLDTPDQPTFDITKTDEYLPWYFSIDKEHRERIMGAFKASGVTIAISSHIHCCKTDVVERIRFIKSPATCMAQMGDRWDDGDGTLGFLRFDVTDEDITDTLVPLQHVSTKKGYGPGGHPLPELRDYSKAWEK